jgi:hypothetical protein
MSLTKQEEFLIKEYESAIQLTYHIDELRNKLMVFYLTYSGVAFAAMAILFKGEARNTLFEHVEAVVGVLLLIVALTGLVVVQGMARLRRVQIEHFRIIGSVRKFFLEKDLNLWNLIQLSAKTLPKPNRKSGTYMWLLLVMLISSSLFSLSVYLFVVKVYSVFPTIWGACTALAAFPFFLVLQDRFYFAWASPAQEQVYTEANPPFVPWQ